jgi:hypothetical protein
MKAIKRIGMILGIIVALLLIIVGAALLSVTIKTNKLNNDYSYLINDNQYNKAIILNNIEVIEQSISCGYATIEMFSKWNNNVITEEDLYKQYGKVTTSTGDSFCKEMNKQFPEYVTTKYSYINNTSLLKKIYTSLNNGIPVPIEWAADYKGKWTLHYSLVIGIDLANDNVIVANPYGYIEKLTIKEFLNRTSFNAYEDMPFYFKLGFAFGIFEKNTVFIVERK